MPSEKRRAFLPRSSLRRPGASAPAELPQSVVEAARAAVKTNAPTSTKLDAYRTIKYKRRSLAELTARRRKAFTALSGEQKEASVRSEIDALRALHRKDVIEQLASVCHSGLSRDLNRFSARAAAKKVGLRCVGDKAGRRNEATVAVRNMLGIRWPGTVDDAVRPCAYDCVTIVAGPDEYAAYMLKTADLRAAQQKLLSGAPLCDSIDTALLCMSHGDCMATDLLSVYNAFEMHSEPFVAFTGADVDFVTFCHTRYGPGAPMLLPQWGMWGDKQGRIVRGQLLRVVEEFVHQMPGPNWASVQAEYTDVLRNDGGRLTGDLLMELHRGELAAEFTCLLWRAVHEDSAVSILPDNVVRMPGFPVYEGPGATATFAETFPPEGGDPTERGRAYVRRLVYTALSCSWFLRSPLMATMLCALERAATTPDFLERSALGPEDVQDAGADSTDSIEGVLEVYRRFVLRLSDGRAEAASRNATALFRANAPKARVGKRTGASTGAPFDEDEWMSYQEDQEDFDYEPSDDDAHRCKYVLSFCFFFKHWRAIIIGTTLSMTIIDYGYEYTFNRGAPDMVFIVPTLLKDIISGFGNAIVGRLYGDTGINNYIQKEVPAVTVDTVVTKVAEFAELEDPEGVGDAAGDTVRTIVGTIQWVNEANNDFVKKYVFFGNEPADVLIWGAKRAIQGTAHAIVAVKDGADLVSDGIGAVGDALNPEVVDEVLNQQGAFIPGLPNIPALGAAGATSTGGSGSLSTLDKKRADAGARAKRLIEGARRTNAADLTRALALAEGTYGDAAPEPDQATTPVSFYAANMNGFATAGYAAIMAQKTQSSISTNLSPDDTEKLVGDDDAVKATMLAAVASDVYDRAGLVLVSTPIPKAVSAPSQQALRINSTLDLIAPAPPHLLLSRTRVAPTVCAPYRSVAIFPTASTHV